MNIGIVIGRIGGVDGVALETEKWMTVAERMGHNCFLLAGKLEAEFKNATVLPELFFYHPDCAQGQDDAFFIQKADEKEFLDRLEKETEYIERNILKWIMSKKIDILLTENSTTLPCHLTMGMALTRVIKKTGIASVSHNHDFHWERGDRYVSRYAGVRKIIKEYFPPDLPNIKHAVINLYCKNSLKKQMGIMAAVVPNVMDFNTPFGQKDEYNKDLPKDLGIENDDIPLFQITRIVRRKGIETAIELIHKLNNPKVKLFITGNAKDDLHQMYFDELLKMVKDLDLEKQVFFVAEHFGSVRKIMSNGKKIYSISDAYSHCRAMTYFSTYEGFGNAFVEALVAKIPIFVNNYKPVYWPDIGSKGFKTVQLEEGLLTDKAIEQMKKIIYDPKKGCALTEFNFALGKKYFSYEVLQKILEKLFKKSDLTHERKTN